MFDINVYNRSCSAMYTFTPIYENEKATIDAHGSQLGNGAAEAIALCPGLASLNISDNHIDDARAAEFLKCPKLETLNIDNNPISEQMKAKLKEHVDQNGRVRKQWQRVAVLLAFIRANRNNPLKYSILPLIDKVDG